MNKLFGRVCWYALVLVGVFVLWLTCYFSLRASPRVSEATWLPQWLASWADGAGNGDFRTVLPFFLLSLLGTLLVLFKDGYLGRIPWKGFGLGIAFLFGLLFVTEGLQIFIESRFFSVWDLIWGSVGILLGVVFGMLPRLLVRR